MCSQSDVCTDTYNPSHTHTHTHTQTQLRINEYAHNQQVRSIGPSWHCAPECRNAVARRSRGVDVYTAQGGPRPRRAYGCVFRGVGRGTCQVEQHRARRLCRRGQRQVGLLLCLRDLHVRVCVCIYACQEVMHIHTSWLCKRGESKCLFIHATCMHTYIHSLIHTRIYTEYFHENMYIYIYI
jgi:hypothetical protein